MAWANTIIRTPDTASLNHPRLASSNAAPTDLLLEAIFCVAKCHSRCLKTNNLINLDERAASPITKLQRAHGCLLGIDAGRVAAPLDTLVIGDGVLAADLHRRWNFFKHFEQNWHRGCSQMCFLTVLRGRQRLQVEATSEIEVRALHYQ